MGISYNRTVINIALLRGQMEYSGRPKRGKNALHVSLFIYYHCRHSSLIETMEKRWCHDPHTSKVMLCNWRQLHSEEVQWLQSVERLLVLYLLHTAIFFSFIGQRTESLVSFHLPLLLCFIFLLDNHELMRQKTQDNLYWICVQSVPRSIRANVFCVHPCTLSNGTCVAFTATGVLLLLENKSKSKQLPLIQEGSTIRFSHPWKAFCLWMWMHGRMHFNHRRVQCHHRERMGK